MLRTNVKASAITNLTDARYFAALEVNWLGFSLTPGEDNYVSPQVVHAIKEWVDGPKICGEFGLQSPAEIITAIQLLNLDAVQLSPVSEMDALVELHGHAPIIREIIIDLETDPENLVAQLEAEQAMVIAFLLNFDKNGIGWTTLEGHPKLTPAFLKTLTSSLPILFSMDFQPQELNLLISEVAPLGISLQGGMEEKVGFKSFEELDELFDQLQILE